VRDRLLNRLLAMAAVGAAGLLAYALGVHPPSTLGSLREGLLYYGVPTLGVILFLLARKLRTATKGRLVALLLAAGLALYLAEGILVLADLLNPHPPFHHQRMARAERAEDAGQPFDRRPKLEVVLDLRREGVPAYPVKYAHQWIPAPIDGKTVWPLSGLAKTPTVVCNETGEYLVYTTDAHGFANPPGLHEAPVEIAVVGDSHAHGECVAPEESAVARLREHHPRTLNLGVGGAGPLTMLALLREYALPLEPQTVLWFHYEGNDTNDLQIERHHPLLRRYLEPAFTQNLRSLPRDEVDKALAAVLDREIERPLNRLFGKNVGRGQSHPLVRWVLLRTLRGYLQVTAESEMGTFDAPLFRQILEVAKEAVETRGGRLVFVYLPGYPARAGDPGEELVEPPHRRQVLTIAREVGLPVIDVWEAFRAQPDPVSLFPFRLPGHYTPEGYTLAAETILQYPVEPTRHQP
jgi:hypothetical protein